MDVLQMTGIWSTFPTRMSLLHFMVEAAGPVSPFGELVLSCVWFGRVHGINILDAVAPQAWLCGSFMEGKKERRNLQGWCR